MAERVFNALNGSEIKDLILREVREKLALDDRFDRAVEVSNGSFTFTLALDEAVQPTSFTVQVSQSYKAPAGQGLPIGKVRDNMLRDIQNNLDRDERFSQHLTYPRVTWKHRLLVDVLIINGDGRPRELAVGDEPMPAPSHVIDLTRKEPVPVVVAAPVNPDQFIVDEHGRKFRMVPVDEPQVESPVTTASVPMRHRQVDNFTGTGLPIEANFKPSPGAAFAESRGGSPISVAVGTGIMETMELGVTHPSLDDGGVGAPDAVRREAGMAVPGQQAGRAHGGIVDLPAGSF